jgi:hypothetical protein
VKKVAAVIAAIVAVVLAVGGIAHRAAGGKPR